MKSKIELGDEVRDLVTGFKGIAVGRTTWLYGCDRISVQPKGVNKEGKTYDNQGFDEPQLEIVKKAKSSIKDKPENHTTGGPRSEPKTVSYKN